ncbi:hypothetical protein NDA14_002765 [Ustilago hordei]|uniref:DNA replication regulator Sld3 C-terminal domain-containing protein n=1 Tax=Ustilago hordei TaxID=120017 RepID=I2FVM9_USTHO|nr:uncharacterized protein UHO2_04514 [Ustilago hordei]KAJ1042479.1 hypothetical protein NDA10_004621 [Ustilago hordei]KAJ1578180.1 hypothetical protein NDA12_006911 [Ustilago hordei]KAJ1592550.1 hypothetical protein NDA15_005482 [Ustilago hordei]KAJ1595773.1 hypothetical protein NDA14_002765 [Ustilago hordei]UTT89853.1 hypothetical protein NDA17_003761 [Ustilago hordei]
MASTARSAGGAPRCEAGASRLGHTGSKTLLVKRACHLEQPDGNSWFGTHINPSIDSRDEGKRIHAQGTLADRYAEALWLGELHTGLGYLLDCIQRLTQSQELQDVLLGLCHLIRSNSAIARRHRAVGKKLALTSEELKDTAASEWQDLTEYERILAQRTISKDSSNKDMTRASSIEPSTVRERWISAMESREIQLQILITMCLLQLVSQEPRALDAARARMTEGTSPKPTCHQAESKPNKDTAAERESEQPRKRSRKLEKAKRWRGTRPNSDLGDAFAWNQQVRRRLATDASEEDGEEGEEDVLEMEGGHVLTVDHLSKRLEALVDILCLRQVASGVGEEIADLLSDMRAETRGDDRESGGGSGGRASLFGSSVRKLVEHDDMDDAQWLCSKVVEPHFEASLPRQCWLFRSKCFVSLQSRTPARSRKSARTGSMSSPPMRAVKQSASIAPETSVSTLPVARLSDVLQKEQAGRRVKRNILAERSSMLGRAREVDMGPRLSRSVSATYVSGRESQAPSSVFSRSGTSSAWTQPNHGAQSNLLEASKGLRAGANAGRSSLQKPESSASVRSTRLSWTPLFAACSASTGSSKRLLVMSTPQKEPASKMINMARLSELEKPRLVLPSLVMESPTQEGPRLTGQRSRIAERCASFGGGSNFAPQRSPSPIALYSDADD